MISKIEYNKEYYKNNIEKIKERSRIWGKNNPEKVRERGMKWRKLHPDKVRENNILWRHNNIEKDTKNHIKWRQNNPEKVREIQIKYYKNNSEKLTEYSKTYRKTNPEKVRESQRNWRHNNPEKKLQYDINQLKKLGKSFDMNSMEYSYALQSWSKSIKKLDNNMCKLCDSNVKLNSHHIFPKIEFPELSLDLDNGVTLCEECHGLVHGFKIYTNNS